MPMMSAPSDSILRRELARKESGRMAVTKPETRTTTNQTKNSKENRKRGGESDDVAEVSGAVKEGGSEFMMESVDFGFPEGVRFNLSN